MTNPPETTLQSILTFMADMKRDILQQIKSSEQKMADMQVVLLKDISNTKKALSKRIDGVEAKVESLAGKVDALQERGEVNHDILQRQIKGIDERLDVIEILDLPKKIRSLNARFSSKFPKRR